MCQSCPHTTIPSKSLRWNKRTEMTHHRLFLAPPAAVAEYNSIMGGVDRFDQRQERYAIGRHSLKWWQHLLYFLIDLAIVNSFIMWNCNNGGQCDQLSFRLALIRQLSRPRDKKDGQVRFYHKKQAGHQRGTWRHAATRIWGTFASYNYKKAVQAMQHKQARDPHKHDVQPLQGTFVCSPLLQEIPSTVTVKL